MYNIFIINLLFFSLFSFISSQIINEYTTKLGEYNQKVTSQEEKEGLEIFFTETNGILWTININWLSGDPCTNYWYGVTCDSNGKIIGLEFVNNHLDGIINNSLQKLPNLKYLRIYNTIYEETNNQIANKIIYINDYIFSHSNLKELVIRSVNLKMNLKYLFNNLNDNNNLEIIDFDFNSLFGELPIFSNFKKLKMLSLSSNNLSGKLDNLETINKDNIQIIQLYDNAFEGNIPYFDCFKNSNIKIIDIRNNTEVVGTLNSLFFDDNYFISLEYIGLMLTNITIPSHCEKAPFCIKKLEKNIKNIKDSGFNLEANELKYLNPR